jgi:hypothetical protein
MRTRAWTNGHDGIGQMVIPATEPNRRQSDQLHKQNDGMFGKRTVMPRWSSPLGPEIGF